MVRTAVDIASTSRDALPPFDLFYRESQKIWDGLAGLCLGVTSGLAISDGVGAKRLPVSAPILAQAEPMFESTLMGTPEAVKWFLEIIHPDN
jgi:3'(2'), 5'-bisphosphate nucleotidase